MRWFFASGKPWFVATAFVADRLLAAAERPKIAPTAPSAPSFVFRLYDAEGEAYGQGLVMTQDFADQHNGKLAREGQDLRWLNSPPAQPASLLCSTVVAVGPPAVSAMYYLYDTDGKRFGDGRQMTQEVADHQNGILARGRPLLRWFSSPPPITPSAVYNLYGSDGNVSGDGLEMTREFADQQNEKYAREGRDWRWLSSPPVHTTPSVEYRFYDSEGKVFSESLTMTQSEADRLNQRLSSVGMWLSSPPAINLSPSSSFFDTQEKTAVDAEPYMISNKLAEEILSRRGLPRRPAQADCREDETQPTIVAGEGLGPVRLGAASKTVDAFLGDGQQSGGSYSEVYFKDYLRKGIQVSFENTSNTVRAIFFYNGQRDSRRFEVFCGHTNNGINWQSSVDEVKKAYGSPAAEFSGINSGDIWQRLEFAGIDFRFENGMMVRIGIF